MWKTPGDFLADSLASRDELEEGIKRSFEKYYHSYLQVFGERMKALYSQQMKELGGLIGQIDTNPVRVLEAGCGCGTESLWMALLGAQVTGIDLDEPRLAVARARQLQLERRLGRQVPVRWHCESLLDHEPEGYDIIWLEQALHHMEPRDLVLAKLKELLRPGGWLVVSEANGLNLALQAQLIYRRGFRTMGEYLDREGNSHPYGIERVMTARGLARKLRKHGFEVAGFRHFRFFPNRSSFDGLAQFEEDWASNTTAPFCTHYNLVAQRPLSDSFRSVR